MSVTEVAEVRVEQSRRAGGLVIFLHIPKTAGTTVMRILEAQYGGERVLKLYESTFGDEVAALTDDEVNRMRVIAGHFYFGVHSRVSRPSRYMTFLRHPIERVVSHYEFVRHRPEHYLYRAASRLSLADYVGFCAEAEPNNDQTRLLAGREMASSDGRCSPEMLAAAKHNLDRHAAVGLAEAFDASLVLMRRVFGWKRPLYVRGNVGERGVGKELPLAVREVIEAHNALDVELYRHAQDRFQRDVSEYGDDFTRDLRVFKQMNALYGRFQGVPWIRTRRPTTRRG